jgi:hypothetical protein
LDGPPVAQTCQSPFCGLFAAGPKEITDAPSLPLKAGISPQKTAAALTASFKSLQLWHLGNYGTSAIMAPRRPAPPQTEAH